MQITKYVKFATKEEADNYLPRIKEHVDAHYQQAGKPTVIMLPPIKTWDGYWAIPLPETYPETSGEVVDTIEQPVIEGKE